MNGVALFTSVDLPHLFRLWRSVLYCIGATSLIWQCQMMLLSPL